MRDMFESDLASIASHGELYYDDPTNPGKPKLETIDPAQLKDAFWGVCRDTVTANGAKLSGDAIYNDPKKPLGSYASAVVGNHPHPETFLSMMHDKFKAGNPNATDQQKKDFAKGLDQMTTTLYGQRYSEYEAQRHDLHLLGADSSPEEHDRHNHEVSLELIGRNFVVRRSVHELAMNAGNRRAKTWAELSNLSSSPKSFVLRNRMQRANDKIHKKRSKFSYRQNKIDNAQARLDSSSVPLFTGLRQQRIDRRQDKLDAAQQRIEDRAAMRTNAYTSHQDMMRGRVDTAHETARINRERYRSHIDRYKGKRDVAIANRALRCELRGVDRRERQQKLEAFYAHATPDQISRLARSKHIEDTTKRKLDQVTRQHRAAIERADEHHDTAVTLEHQLKENEELAKRLNDKITRLRNHTIPSVERSVKDAADTLESADPNDPAYESLVERYNTHAMRLEKLQLSVERSLSTVADLSTRTTKMRKQQSQALRQERTGRLTAVDLYNEREDARATHGNQAGSFRRTLDKTNFGPQ